MLAGLGGLAIAFIPSTSAGDPGGSAAGFLAVISMVVFIASFALSLGPVVWTLISEIFPNRIRGEAMAVSTAFNWGAAFVLTLLFPDILDAIGASATFALLAAVTVVVIWWMNRYVPETKGVTGGGHPDLAGRRPGMSELRTWLPSNGAGRGRSPGPSQSQAAAKASAAHTSRSFAGPRVVT